MGVRGPCARPRRLLASELALALATLLALLVPGAQALEECALYSQDGVLVDDIFWESEMISLAQDKFATEPLQDTAGPNFDYYRFKTENIHSVQINPQIYKDAKYFKAYLDGDNLVIATSEFFGDIEKDTSRETTTAVFMVLEIGCGSSTSIRKLQLDLMMFDSNNWKPDATQSSYALSLPVPVPAGTFLLDVPGFDYDMTGRGVEVSVEVDNAQYQGLFSARASAVVNRGFTVTLSSAMEIRVKEPVAFTLRIKDLGTSNEPTVIQESPVRVTFTPDLENSVFSPRFQRALYTAKVLEAEEVSAGTAVLAAPIAFEEGFTENLDLALEDGDMHSGVPATEFVEVVRVDEALELRWKASLDADRLAAFLAQPYALLLLTATAANAPQTARTVVHLALPGAYTVCSTEAPPGDCDCSTTVSSPVDCSAECPTSSPSTECPITCEDCPATDSSSCSTDVSTGDGSSTACPPIDCSTECPSTPSTECPTTCEDCPTTDSSSCPTDVSTDDGSSTTCPPIDCSTECPTTCEDCPATDSSSCPTDVSTDDGSSTTCPPIDCSTECPSTPSTECPTTCEDCPATDCSSSSTDISTGDGSSTACPPVDCSTECPSTPSTECPTTCEDCPATDSSSSSTDISTGDGSSTACPPVDCSTECPNTPSTECPTTCEDCTTTDSSSCPTDVSTDDCFFTCPPIDCSTDCPTSSPPTECPTTCEECEDCPATDSPGCSTDVSPGGSSSTACPPTDCSTECPTITECPCEGTPEPTQRLRFEQATYSKLLNRDDPQGELVAQPRLANPDAVSGVRFSLEKEWEASPLGLLDVNAISGAVTLRVSPPPAGTFLYRIVASAPGAHSAYAQLLVMGPAGVECNEDGGEVCFTHAVSVQWINEHIAQDVLRAMPVQDCTFSALSGQEYFDVDARTGAARMRAVDREDAAFDGAEAPVLRLWVHMSCDGDDARAPPVARAGSDYGNWTKMLGDVAHDPRSTVVLVEIVDINDNTPVFNPPSIVVGFPDSSLAERLRLPALFTAQATDRDVGLNAQLHYSLDEAGADVLQVDAVSGAVYPRSDVPPPASGQRVVVRATDRNGPFGADGSRTGNLDVTLVALAEEHLVEVRVEGALPEEAEQLLQDGAGSGRELRLLSATVLPGEGSRSATAAAPTPLPHLLRVRRAPQQDNSQDEDDGADGDGDENEGEETFAAHLRVVLYSLRNGSPESADQFKKEVEEQLKTNGWQAKAEAPQLGGGGGGGGDAGLLAAVITLAVLLGLLLVAAGIVGYWFGVRPRMAEGKRLSENGSPSQLSVVDIEPLRDEMLKKPPSPTMAYGDDRSVAGQGRGLGLAPPPGADAVRPSVMLGLPGEADARDTESDDYMPAPSDGYERPRPASENSYEELLPELAPAPVPAPAPAPAAAPEADDASVTSDPPARKSVFFNEEVDCIEIRM